MRYTLGFSAIGVTALVFVLTGYWLVATRNEGKVTNGPTRIAATQDNQSFGSTHFYLMKEEPTLPESPTLADYDAFMAAHAAIPNADTYFDNRNSTGVKESLAQQFPELLPDFVFIGDENASREQFLLNQNHVFADPTHFYKTEICDRREVNGEVRVLVRVRVGTDLKTLERGYSNPLTFIGEIWRIDANGGAPVLLDRIINGYRDDVLWEFNGLLTTAESPPKRYVSMETVVP